MGSALRLRPFRREDYPWYRAWYDDAELDAQLGPMDEEWLTAVLTESTGEQLVAVETAGPRAGEPAAVVGIVWGIPEHPEHTISDLAVCPALRRTGVGQRVIAALAEHRFGAPARGLIAYVDPDNPGARAFFAGLGWAHTPPPPGEADPMHAYRAPASEPAPAR
ncbi:GNAT family N-acetyltransferase [Leucobacter sp. M11]|uniref:GNAT family N-acetyltransferase n=1 Tax=Leucobacter sp. M11 TaxID=2993565 RepID=UPI002D7F78B6|nr:GNAT family N-acetyltransferase [Leucobacter sp. M11]MEB4614072.1 GNAT family N-acetyltransferase [Leucobacter sp. M11]